MHNTTVPKRNLLPRPQKPRGIAGMLTRWDNGKPFFVGEGGNLGDTPSAVFKYAMKHGCVYTDSTNPGDPQNPDISILQALFRQCTAQEIKSLASRKPVRIAGHTVTMYRSSGSDCYFQIQKDRKYAKIINASAMFDEPPETSQEISQTVREIYDALKTYDFFSVSDFRTIGHMGLTIAAGSHQAWIGELPPEPHTSRFWAAYRNCRMQAFTLGRIERAFDHDIRSAYPAKLCELKATKGLKWFDNPNLIYAKHAVYGVALCDLKIAKIHNPPIAWRPSNNEGEFVYSPYGVVKNAWLTLPEIRLVQRNPEIVKVIKVHCASWGMVDPSQDQYERPYNTRLSALFDLRQRFPEHAPYFKLIANSLYGRLIGVNPDGTASGVWNPVHAATLTAQVRCQLWESSRDSQVHHEAVDGVLTDKPLETGDAAGDLRSEGDGAITIFSDFQKVGINHKLPNGFDISQPDECDISVTRTMRHTINSLAGIGANGAKLGTPFGIQFTMPTGATFRKSPPFLTLEELQSDAIPTEPLSVPEIRQKEAVKTLLNMTAAPGEFIDPWEALRVNK